MLLRVVCGARLGTLGTVSQAQSNEQPTTSKRASALG